MQKYAGVNPLDLLSNEETRTEVEKFADGKQAYVTWDRPAMGMTGSPYQAVQTATRGKRLTLGDRRDLTNPFRWDTIVQNLLPMMISAPYFKID
jgi:hypothetical protein